MSKKPEYTQSDLFPEEPKIKALGICDFKIKDNEISGKLTGVCNKADIAQIDNNCWRLAVAEWLVELCGGNSLTIDNFVNEAKINAYELKKERELADQESENSNIRTFPKNSHGEFVN